ncbi:DUF2279 domain-containing protein [Seonamhaeicola algicola]|uniref:DUF2279 domain-containing protein n=1 Tax=Seonamhaeicola algicola TaxID=1719036 RepID=UPI003742CB80
MKQCGNKYILPFFLLVNVVFGQAEKPHFFKPSDTLNIPRRNLVVISEASLATVSLIGLNQLWYANYDKSKFHTINDNNEWLQMDKVGHVFTAYQIGSAGANLLKWSGVSKKDQLLYGATLGFSFLTAVEVLDGFSKEWGFSWGDVFANATGTGLYIGQALLWKEQRISLKYSFHQTAYASQNPSTLGANFSEQILKDYNGQTYWLSFNLHAFFKRSNLPKWLNIAVGYGAEGMLGNLKDIDNQLLTNKKPMRQFYLSFDVNLKNIKTKSPVLSSIFSVLNAIKIPFPALEFNKKGSVFHPFYY